MEWKDITLRQFNKIQELLEVEDEYTSLNILDYLFEIDSADLPLSEFGKYRNSLKFLSESIPNVEIEKEYTINGRTYTSSFDLTVVTTAQFIDYNNYCKEEKKDYAKLLSVFFIPKGHNYNDGYNMREVQEDLQDLNIAVVQSAAFFMTRQFQIFASLFLHYLTETLKKEKMNTEKKKQIIEILEQADLANSELFRLS